MQNPKGRKEVSNILASRIEGTLDDFVRLSNQKRSGTEVKEVVVKKKSQRARVVV